MIHEMNTQYGKKFTSNRIRLGHTLSIRKINENQLVRLMIINKEILMRNRNDNRFHSHDSWISRRSRTQSTTIPNFANPNRLYIYKKRECVEMLTVSRKHVDSQKRLCHIGYIKFIRGHAYWSNLLPVKPRGAEIYTDTHSEV